jgi:hypothetical protein
MPVEEPTLAMAVLLLVHVPPGVVLLSVMQLPTHIVNVVPDMAAGLGLTVTTVVVKQPVDVIV